MLWKPRFAIVLATSTGLIAALCVNGVPQQQVERGTPAAKMKPTSVSKRWTQLLSGGAMVTGFAVVSQTLRAHDDASKPVRVVSHQVTVRFRDQERCSFAGAPVVDARERESLRSGLFVLPGRDPATSEEPFRYDLLLEPRTGLVWADVTDSDDLIATITESHPQ